MDDLSNDTRYDELIFLVDGKELTTKTLQKQVKELFPEFSGKSTNDSRLSDYVIEKYTYARSIGMDVQQAAYAAEVSQKFIGSCLEGKDLSLERFVMLVKKEIFAAAQLRQKQLTVLTDAAANGDTKSAITLIEKIWPKLYAKKLVTEDQTPPERKMSDDELDSKIRSLITQIQDEIAP